MKAAERLARDPNLKAVVREVEESMAKTFHQDVSRRAFLKVTGLAGGGLVLGMSLSIPSPAKAQSSADNFSPNAFLKISTDGLILIYNKNPEVGQGIKTAFPMIIAEELDADWEHVQVEQSPINESIYGRQAAGGSRSIPSSWDELRGAGAAARSMLVAAAAEIWSVSTDECSTARSIVTHDPTGRRLTYGELAEPATKQPVPDPTSLTLKARDDYRLLGKRITGVDNDKVVTGQPLFGIDTTLPGMV